MRRAAASLAIALLLLMPLAGMTGSPAHTSCSMSCCLSGAHACPIRATPASCRACGPESNAHATTIAKVVVAMSTNASPLIETAVAPRLASAAPPVDVAPPPVPPPQRG